MLTESSLDLEEAAALRHAVLRLTRRLRRHSGTELTPSQMSALSTLERHGETRVGELARREHIGKSSVTRLLARLEALRLIDRSPDATDRRSFTVGLTDDGRSVLADANARANAYLARQLAALGPKDRRALQAALPALQRLLDVRA